MIGTHLEADLAGHRGDAIHNGVDGEEDGEDISEFCERMLNADPETIEDVESLRAAVMVLQRRVKELEMNQMQEKIIKQIKKVPTKPPSPTIPRASSSQSASTTAC